MSLKLLDKSREGVREGIVEEVRTANDEHSSADEAVDDDEAAFRSAKCRMEDDCLGGRRWVGASQIGLSVSASEEV